MLDVFGEQPKIPSGHASNYHVLQAFIIRPACILQGSLPAPPVGDVDLEGARLFSRRLVCFMSGADRWQLAIYAYLHEGFDGEDKGRKGACGHTSHAIHSVYPLLYAPGAPISRGKPRKVQIWWSEIMIEIPCKCQQNLSRTSALTLRPSPTLTIHNTQNGKSKETLSCIHQPS